MKGPLGFWSLLLGGIGAAFVAVWALSPGSPAEPPANIASIAVESAAAQAPPRRPIVRLVERPEPAEGSAATDVATSEQWDAAADDAAPSAGKLSAADAAARIDGTRPALVIIFSTRCSLSQRAFPDFVRISRALEGRVPVVAFATDSNPANVDRFLQGHGAGFTADRLARWQPGELSHAMSRVGISIGNRFVMPVIAVIGPRGEVLGKWEAQTDLEPVAATIHRMSL